MHKIFVKIVPRFINKINNYQLYPLQRLHSEKEKFTPTLTPQKKSAKAQTKNTTKVCTWVFKKKKKKQQNSSALTGEWSTHGVKQLEVSLKGIKGIK